MKSIVYRMLSAATSLLVSTSALTLPFSHGLSASAIVNNQAQNVLEYLDRGISAVKTDGGMLVNWRWTGSDSDDAVFKLYRDGTLIYTSEGNDATCYLDARGSGNSRYRVDTYSGNRLTDSSECHLINGNGNYFDIALSQPGTGYTPNDMSVGDVDGDGQYELFLKWDPSNSKDNSQKGKTDPVYIDCYTLEGKRLWRINLGFNIRAGAHYTQFFVADFDLDGKAEMTCKTADGTVDGTGKVIGDSSKDYRNSNGYVLSGSEYYTLFDGATGAALDTVDYKPGRGTVKNWGDSYGNRVDRFWGTVAYLDGVHPCVVTGRGYYTRMTATAYKVENKKLVEMWYYDTGNSNSSSNSYGDGNHNSMPADVDGDGKQEIVTGSAIIDDNGTLYYTTKQGHGDAMHVGDLDPTNPGLELWMCHEEKTSGYGVSLIDLDQKKVLYHQNGDGDTGRCCADNIWTGNPGAECWGNKITDGSTPVVDTKGNTLDCRRPAINFLSYWDGDLEREILDGYTDSPAKISKVTGDAGKTTITELFATDGYYTCNTTKGTPCLSADIFGDWREELIVRKADGKGIRIYCTSYDTDYRVTTLMHDAQYRMQVSAQNTAYNQPPHTSFFLGTGYDLPARTDYVVNGEIPVVGKEGAEVSEQFDYYIMNVNSLLYLSSDNGVIMQGEKVLWNLKSTDGRYYQIIEKSSGLALTVDDDSNGSVLSLKTAADSENQLFKFVDNGDGSYTICTKQTKDESCVGIASASRDSGASAVQWTCNDSDDQKWELEAYIAPIEGKTFSLQAKDAANYQGWKIGSEAKTGEPLFGDREVVYTELPESVTGYEYVISACDSKNSTGNLAEITAKEDLILYVALDSRVENIPEWLDGWEKTELTVKNDKDVSFILYKKSIKEGETLTLGANGQSSGCVNYTVLSAPMMTTSEKVKGDVNADGKFDVADVVLLQKWLLAVSDTKLADWEAGDLCGDGQLDVFDLCMMKRLLVNG